MQQNPDDARYCTRCGGTFPPTSSAAHAEPAPSLVEDQQLWEMFIGPSKSIQFTMKKGWSWEPAVSYYLEKFRRFHTSAGIRFAWTWHWPAALFDPFLWFLYRKMYMYALLYAVGPVLSAFLTGDLSVGIIWRFFAGASANYLYFWHVKDRIRKIRSRSELDALSRARQLKEEGGVQLYVLWLGAALHLFMIGLLLAALGQGSLPEGPWNPGDEGSPPKFF